MGPNYERPTTFDVSSFEGTGEVDKRIGWKIGEPADHEMKGEWWRIFNDPLLNDLQNMALKENQSLQAALSRIDSARATSRQSKSEFYPELSTEPSYDRTRSSDETNTGSEGKNPRNEFSVPFDLSYEVDLWGRVRRQVESSYMEAEASVADYQNLMLMLQSELAQNYFNYLALSEEIEILRISLKKRRESLELISKRAKYGNASDLDLYRAESDLKTNEAELSTLELQQAQLKNAIATIVGQPASTFVMPIFKVELPDPPQIPVGLPSVLLERRPDVAAAEKRLAARNAEIGVAKASFFPVVQLTGDFGFKSDDLANLFTASGRTWSYGPSIFIPIFQAGRLLANLERSKSEYTAHVADYRQQILIAFQDVEDSLVEIEYLAKRLRIEMQASEAAQKAERLSQIRYESGVVDYLETLDAQRTSLELQRDAVQTKGQKLIAAITLIKAIGGGW